MRLAEGEEHGGENLVLVVFAAAAVGICRRFGAEMRFARAGLLAGSRVMPAARGPAESAEEGDGPPVLVVPRTACRLGQMGAVSDQWP